MRTLRRARMIRRTSKRWLLGTTLLAFAVLLAPGGAVIAQTQKTEPKKKVKIRVSSYYYSAFNRRDPFRSLVVGEFVSEKRMKPVELGRVELVGVLRGDLDRFALLEDDKGFSYIMRIGDRVRNGSIVAIGDDSMVARVTNFGQTRKVTLHLAKRGENR